ncbi:MAG: small ribosomal subunit Rsm22 family protein, partial [Chthoniobacterales bacterium]
FIKKLLSLLAPDALLILLEPALKETATRLMQIRDTVTQSTGLKILSPCLHHEQCALLAEGRFWYHEVRKWQPPPSLQRINSMLHRKLHELKWSHLVLQKTETDQTKRSASTSTPLQARLIAPMAKMKGQFLTRVCAEDSQLKEIAITTSKLDPPTRHTLKNLNRGDLVTLDNLHPLKNPNSWRAKHPGSFRLSEF